MGTSDRDGSQYWISIWRQRPAKRRSFRHKDTNGRLASIDARIFGSSAPAGPRRGRPIRERIGSLAPAMTRVSGARTGSRPLTSRLKVATSVVLGVFLGSITGGPGIAVAHQDPTNCNTNGLNSTLTATPTGSVRDGTTLTYTVSYSNTGATACNITGLNASLTLPNATSITLLSAATLNVGDSINCPGDAECVTGGPYTYIVVHANETGPTSGCPPVTGAITSPRRVTAFTQANGILHSVEGDDAASDCKTLSRIVIHPHTTLTKTASPTSGDAPLTVTYTYTETNDSPATDPTGADAISSVVVTDDKCSPLSAPSGDTNTNSILDVGETWTFTCTHTYNAGDAGVPGTITNTATANGTVVGDGLAAPVETAQARVDVSVLVTPTVATEIHAGSNAGPLPHTVITSATAGSTVHDHATVSPPATPPGLPTPAGTVTFSRFDNGSCTAPAASTETKTLSGGSAESSDFVIPTTGVTAISYQVHYTPDASQANTYTAADSVCEPLTVTPLVQALTPGFWKNHEAATTALLPQTLGGFSVVDFATATAVFAGMNCSNSSRSTQNAVGCLAGHLLAAKLNVANGASSCIAPTITAADAFLISVSYVGPTGTYPLTDALRATAISLKSTLDAYNNTGVCV